MDIFKFLDLAKAKISSNLSDLGDNILSGRVKDGDIQNAIRYRQGYLDSFTDLETFAKQMLYQKK